MRERERQTERDRMGESGEQRERDGPGTQRESVHRPNRHLREGVCVCVCVWGREGERQTDGQSERERERQTIRQRMADR